MALMTPIIDNNITAFVKGGSLTIDFYSSELDQDGIDIDEYSIRYKILNPKDQLSSFNDGEDFKPISNIALSDRNTTITDTSFSSSNKYYITINDINDTTLNPTDEKLYVIQIQLVKGEEVSDWSNKVLRYRIFEPKLQIRLDNTLLQEGQLLNTIKPIDRIVLQGQLSFGSSDEEAALETDELLWYKIYLGTTEKSSGEIGTEKFYPRLKNQMGYVFVDDFEEKDSQQFTLGIIYATKKGWIEKKQYRLECSDSLIGDISHFSINYTIQPTPYLGTNIISLELQNVAAGPSTGQIVVQKGEWEKDLTIPREKFPAKLQGTLGDYDAIQVKAWRKQSDNTEAEWQYTWYPEDIIIVTEDILSDFTVQGVYKYTDEYGSQQFDIPEDNLPNLELVSLGAVVGDLRIWRRATHTSIWEFVTEEQNISINIKDTQTVVYEDRLAQIGLNYQYKIHFIRSSDKQTWEVLTDEYCLMANDIYLMTNVNTLRVSYDANISSYKYNVTDAVTSTLGSRYPSVRRNGNMKYRTFSIGGMISYRQDIVDVYSTNWADSQDSTSIVKHKVNLVEPTLKYSSFFSVTPYDDFGYLPEGDNRERVMEKIFREHVLEFLYADDVKLLKSLPEGDILVKLINVSLTPNTTLGRNIYSFTAQAIEVAKATKENCDKYNVTRYLDADTEQTRLGVYGF